MLLVVELEVMFMSSALHQQLHLYPLAFFEEDGEVVVGRPDINSFGVFPRDGAALLRQLADGRTPASAAAWYTDTYHEQVDLAEFLATLHQLGFVRQSGERPASSPAIRWQGLGRALFSPPAWIAYTALVLLAVTLCVQHPQVRPRAGNIVFSDYLLLVTATVAAGQLALTGFHELFHVLAARRLGVRSTVRLSRRFYFIVLETNLDGLAVLPRRERVLPILAGLVADSLAFSGLTVSAFLAGPSSWAAGVCLALASTTLLRMSWQFFFFLRTDIYYLVATLSGCPDLDAAARAQLVNTVQRLRGRPPHRDLSAFRPRDRQAAHWFAPLLVLGYGVMVGTQLWTLPVLWHVLSSSAGKLVAVPHGQHGTVWDARIFLALVLAQIVFALTLALRRQRPRERTLR